MDSVVIAATHQTITVSSSETPAWATAIGTLALALATFALNWKTRALAISGDQTAKAAGQSARAAEQSTKVAEQEILIIRDQADAAQRHSKASEEALNASLRPLLIDIPRHTMRTIPVQERPGEKRPAEIDLSVISGGIAEAPRTGHLTVPVRNVGPGVALGLAAAVTFARGDLVGAPMARGEAPSVIAPAEPEAIWFGDTAGAASAAAETPLVRLLREGEDLVVEVAYSDIAGRVTATSIFLTKSGTTDRAYRVTRVDPGHEPRITAHRI